MPELWLKDAISWLSLAIEAVASLIIAIGATEAVIKTTLFFFKKDKKQENRSTRLHLGRWLTLALEFLLAADILRTAVKPNWNEIGQLAAIATIRTALNYFLEREIKQEESSRNQDA